MSPLICVTLHTVTNAKGRVNRKMIAPVSDHSPLVASVQPDETTLGPVAESAREYARQAKASNTRRAYASDWRHFTCWCASHGRTLLPASRETVALYLSALADTAKASTLTRRVLSIS